MGIVQSFKKEQTKHRFSSWPSGNCTSLDYCIHEQKEHRVLGYLDLGLQRESHPWAVAIQWFHDHPRKTTNHYIHSISFLKKIFAIFHLLREKGTGLTRPACFSFLFLLLYFKFHFATIFFMFHLIISFIFMFLYFLGFLYACSIVFLFYLLSLFFTITFPF